MEFSRPYLNRLLLRRSPEFDERLAAVKRGEKSIRSIDKEGNTLLHLAVLENRIDQLQSLLAYGLTPLKQNCYEMSPLDLAHFLNRQDFLPLLQAAKEPPLITIFRNSDKKKHRISIKEFEEKLKIKYTSYLEFEHPDFLRWAAWKSQRELSKEKFRKMNRWILALHKKAILTPSYDHIYIRHINSSLGYGVFSNHEISALTYIGEYTGVVKRKKPRATRFNDYVFGYMTGPKDAPFIIDAKDKGSFTRFINHSDDPNLSSRWVVAGGVTRIIVFANQLISEGQQLTYDYGKYYWRSRSCPALI